jgi:hypothetical protein
MNMIGTKKSEFSHFARERPLKGEPGMLHASAASRVLSVKDLLQLNDVETCSRFAINAINLELK